MIKLEVLSILDKYPVIALAVSGGSDSMAMLEWFRQNRPKDSFVILNVDHHIRGKESKRDSDFVANYAKKYNIKLYHYDVDALAFAKENSYTIEQAARILRHNIYEQATMEYAYAVATAHHMQDQSESIFMHIARGSGINGLIGMRIEEGHIIRPLLATTKAEIEEYIKKNNIEYCEDSTNSDNSYSRNFVRNEVLPLIRQKYPNIDTSLLKLSERAKEIEDFVDQSVQALFVEDDGVYCDFSKKHKVIKSEIIRRAFSLLGIRQDIESKHIDKILTFFQSDMTGSIDMPYNTIVYKEDEGVVICKKTQILSNKYRFSEGFFEIGGFELQVSKVKGFDKSTSQDLGKDLYIATDNLDNLEIRLRDTGDVIEKFGGGSKSLGDFLTDKKVPLRLRDRLPIIASGKDVVCVCGVEIGAKAKVFKNSQNIYKIKLQRLN